MLSGEVKSLLDKLYNLRGEDSVVLTKINKERQEAIETQERTKNEKEVLTNEIERLSNEERVLAEQGNKLIDVLNSINKNEFSTVLERLGINFEPENINSKVHQLLPETIENVVLENKKATEKLEKIEEEMRNSATLVEELGLRKDEALSNQSKLNEFFNLALHGNINITRDEITNLLAKFDFSENEQREAAKILMFPEDALYDYDSGVKNGEQSSGKSMAEIFSEAKATVDDVASEKQATDEVVEPVNNETIEEEKEQNEPLNNYIEAEEEKVDAPNSFVETAEESVVKEEQPEKTEEEQKEDEPLINEETEDIADDVFTTAFKNFEKQIEETTNNEEATEVEEKVVEETTTGNDNIVNSLKEMGIDSEFYNDSDLEKLMNNYDEALVKENVNVLKEKGIDLKVLKDNIKLLMDKELKEKIEKLLEIGKEVEDINLMPKVLSKYDLKGLINTINVLQISGLDPKKVPLMAF